MWHYNIPVIENIQSNNTKIFLFTFFRLKKLSMKNKCIKTIPRNI